ncbi:ITGAL isoform 7, partial [Pan troglodytes]
KEGVNITICFQIKSLIPQFQAGWPPDQKTGVVPRRET